MTVDKFSGSRRYRRVNSALHGGPFLATDVIDAAVGSVFDLETTDDLTTSTAAKDFGDGRPPE